jgi:hypothetical protein
LTSLIGDCTLLSSAELAAPAFVAAALATPDTQSFEIGGRASPRVRDTGSAASCLPSSGTPAAPGSTPCFHKTVAIWCSAPS